MNQAQANFKQEAIEFADQIIQLYFIDHNLHQLLAYMVENVSWMGTDQDEICKNKIEVQTALMAELNEYSGSFTIKKKEMNAVWCSDTSCIVYGFIQAELNDSTLTNEDLRFSIILTKTAQGLTLNHVHLSHVDFNQKTMHCDDKNCIKNNIQTLKHTLDLRNRQLDILSRNLPGSAHQCKNNPNFTLIATSDSFLTMFGYTQEEIKELFHNNFIEMVYPQDRAMLIATIHEQLKKGKDIELEYRVLCKDGKPVWVLDKGRLLEDSEGHETFFCLLLEITERKEAQEELRLSLERHQVIMDQATDIIFEWDIRKDTLFFSPNWVKKFGYSAIDYQISARIPCSENIHCEDMSAFLKIMKDTAAGVPYSETEFRIRDQRGTYHWCRIRATAQYDADGRAIKAVGVILDIDDEKKQKLVLLEMAQKDALTGLYNKAAIDALVAKRMNTCSERAKQALLILDVDHFKTVNDTYGHLVGDRLLSSIAGVIKNHISSDDLAGRIGGDEFLIYMASVDTEVTVLEKAEKLLHALSRISPIDKASPITCSVGVAVFAYGKVDYHTFYKCADQALYLRKKCGRKGITLYQSTNPIQEYNSMSAVNEDVGTERGDMIQEQLVQYAFRKLYHASDICVTIERLLEIIGQAYDVSRVYIFENSEDRQSCIKTFEWCAKGVEPLTLTNTELREKAHYFNHLGLFYCFDEECGISSIKAQLHAEKTHIQLQCAMLDEGEFVGYVGFDECRENRIWESKQVTTFQLTADVLSTFLMKFRFKQKTCP